MTAKNLMIDYLYRDADNYKVWNTVVLNGTLTEKQIADIIGVLNDGEYFIPSQVGLPEQRFEKLSGADHCWFELSPESFNDVDDKPTVDLTATELYENFMKIKSIGWDDTKFPLCVDDVCIDDDDEDEDDAEDDAEEGETSLSYIIDIDSCTPEQLKELHRLFDEFEQNLDAVGVEFAAYEREGEYGLMVPR